MVVINNVGKFDFIPLIEKRINQDSSPINIFAAKVSNYPIHLHPELEIIYVLKGTVMLRSSVDRMTLSAGDIFIVNSMDMHEITGTDEDNSVIFLHIDLAAYKAYAPEVDRVIFASQSSGKNTTDLIKEFMMKIYMEKQTEKVYSLTVKLILHLINHCQFASRHGNTLNNNSELRGKKNFHIQRIQRIADYIYDNYDSKITLEEIAEREFISKYYLSHILKHAVGLGFQEILTLVRIEESEKILLSTNHPIEEVAHLCGCSSPLYYSRNFKAYFDDTPSAYRVKNRQNMIYNTSTDIEILNGENGMQEMKSLYAGNINQLEIGIRKPLILSIDLEDKPERTYSERSLKACLEIRNIKDYFNISFDEMIYGLGNDLKLTGISIVPSQLEEMYDFFGSWGWSNPLLSIMKEKDLVMIFEKQKSGQEEFHSYCLALGVRCETGKKVALNNTVKSGEGRELHKIAEKLCGKDDFLEIKTATGNHLLLEEYMLFSTSRGNFLRRKEYYRLSLLPLMEGEIISRGNDHTAVRKHGDCGIFLHNTETTAVKEFIIKLEKIDKNYSVIEYQIYDEQDELDLYKMMGSPKKLTQEAVDAMKRTVFPKATFSTVEETFFHDFYIVVPPGGSALLHLRQI